MCGSLQELAGYFFPSLFQLPGGQVVDEALGTPEHVVNDTVLVTGGSGFIGSHLVEMLLELGYRVKVYDNLETGGHGLALPMLFILFLQWRIQGLDEVNLPMFFFLCFVSKSEMAGSTLR